MFDPCLSCPLSECDEKNSDCLLITPEKKAKQKWYKKLKADPVRWEKYKQKKQKIKKRYLQTREGRLKWNAQVRRYQKRKRRKNDDDSQSITEGKR
jgi:hypothetical protein